MANGRSRLAAQNCHQEEKGAYNGEVSVTMIESVGADYVIIGHSERRQYFGETNQIVSITSALALQQGLTHISRIEDTTVVRESTQHFEVVGMRMPDASCRRIQPE